MADVPFRWGWVAILALALQLFLVYLPTESQGGLLDPRSWLLTLSYLLLFLVVWGNRRLSGMVIVGLGLLMNFVVIMANGGFMPITPEVLRRAGHADLAPRLESGALVSGTKDIVLTREETRLWILSDIFVIPSPLPLASAFSPGDLFIALGIFVLLQEAMGAGLFKRI
ncbi:MAG TPA: hypothetical protein EYP55_09900 [Anaerolineae bacterium]|nr:hypothetical protein [Anaerolineae bacterium]